MNTKKKITLKGMIERFAAEKKINYFMVLITGAVAGVLSVAPFYLMFLFIKELALSDFVLDMDRVRFYALWILITQLTAIVFTFLSIQISHSMAFRIEENMRYFGMKRLIDLPLGFFEREDTGRLRRQIDDQASKTHSFIAHNLPDVTRSIFIFITFLVIMFLIDWKLALVNLAGLGLGVAFLGSMMNQEIKEYMKEYFVMGEVLSISGTEYIRGIPIVKVFQQTVESFQNFYKAIMDYDNIGKKIVFGFRQKMIMAILALGLPSLVLVPVTLYFMSGSDNPALLFAKGSLMILLSYLLLTNFMTVMKIQESQQQYILSISGVLRLEQEDVLEVMKDKQDNSPRSEGIDFKDVSFTYPGREKPALKGFSFHFDPKLSYALVGPSGSGKSTIIKLIARLYDPQQGEICIDGKNVKTYPEQKLYEKMSIVFQENSLITGSLRDNVTMGFDAADEAVIKALKDAASEDILERVGLDNLLGRDGTYVSGGEKQRINIARAYLRHRPILLLDEASAYADAENEVKIQKSLEKVKEEATTISIAHRLTSIQNADCILVLEDGELIESGSHIDLLQNSKLYAQLVSEYSRAANWSLEEVGA